MYDEMSRNAILDSHIASADGLFVLFFVLFIYLFCGTESFAIFSCPRAHIYGVVVFFLVFFFLKHKTTLNTKVPQQIHKMIPQYQSCNLK